jgi:hypothetical protein
MNERDCPTAHSPSLPSWQNIPGSHDARESVQVDSIPQDAFPVRSLFLIASWSGSHHIVFSRHDLQFPASWSAR